MKTTVIVVFGTIGLVMLLFGAYEVFMQRRLMASSQEVQATISESSVSISRDLSTDSNSSPSAFSYEPVVKFSYEIAGKQHESTLLRPLITGRAYNSEAAAANELTPFPAGKRVVAFVNPKYPDRAYLLREPSQRPVNFMIIGVIVLGIIAAAVKLAKLF